MFLSDVFSTVIMRLNGTVPLPQIKEVEFYGLKKQAINF